MKKSDYFNQNGEPINKLSYCAFLDVLGFSERIKASYETENPNDLLQKFHHILQQNVLELKKVVDEGLLYYKSFSDNVVLAYPQFSEDMESEFGFILGSIQEYQFQMALQGFFVRGGLSLGDLFVDEVSIYGQALLEAYDLENTQAVNPVVLLSDDVRNLVNHHLTYYGGDGAPQQRELLMDSQGRYFINYLSESIIYGDSDMYLDTESLKKHKFQIEEALNNYQNSPKVFSKFTWLSAYHDHFCDSVSEFDNYEEQLKINSELTETKFKIIGAP